MIPANEFGGLEAAIGYLVSPTGRRIPIKSLSFTANDGWWGGRAWLLRGETIEPGAYRLAMNDGRTADLSIDEVGHYGTTIGLLGFAAAAFHGLGPAP
jgi:hypothetical protein